MAIQEKKIWVHGTSGVVMPEDYNHPCDWGDAYYRGWGLDLVGNVIDTPGNVLNEWDPWTTLEPWVHFHIPTPGGEKVLLREVRLVFSTDSNPASSSPIQHYPYRYFVDAGGVMVKQLHIWDGYRNLGGENDLTNWQSPDINTRIELPLTLERPEKVYYGVGVSVRLWFKNQWCIKQETNISGNWVPTPGWNGQPFMLGNVTAPTSHTKFASIASVGCVFLITP